MLLQSPHLLRGIKAAQLVGRLTLPIYQTGHVQCRFASTIHVNTTVRSPQPENNTISTNGRSPSPNEGETNFTSLEEIKHSSVDDLMEENPYRVKITWAHPTYEIEHMKQVKISHLEPQCWQDRVALNTLQVVRKSFDLATRYKHAPPGEEDNPKYQLTKEQWLRRLIFLESIAGVPGMVGGMVRHLQSLRLLKRDNAWMESLIEEAYNERMHLMSFIKIANPGWFMRLTLLGAQGVFFNVFFLAYLIVPRMCHRFVGYLEEEAIVTYTRCINDLEKGQLPEFSQMKAPDIAIEYWKMDPNATVKDMIYYIRADESKHREVNHTLGNLKSSDPNPYAIDYSELPPEVPRPTDDLKFSNTHPVGWKRNEIKF